MLVLNLLVPLTQNVTENFVLYLTICNWPAIKLFAYSYLLFFHAPNKPKFPITILINNKAIDEDKYIKYLDATLDSQLSFKFHIDELTKKISRGIGLLYKLRPFVTTKILTNVYYAIIYPFLLYGIAIWGAASKNLLNPILVQSTLVTVTPHKITLPAYCHVISISRIFYGKSLINKLRLQSLRI